jgi:L-aminopeptidase/D-esterase-like protein
MQPGPRNLITDVPGLTVGNAHDARLASGVTVLLAETPLMVAAVVFGGGPGTRETDAVGMDGTVDEVHAIVLSGGSAFGLDAATGVQSLLRERGIGFRVGVSHQAPRVPVVPQAILFDLANGGEKNWGRHPPYRDQGYEAAVQAAQSFDLGSAGAGYGASVAWKSSGERLRGGLGSASFSGKGFAIGALVAVNAAGTVTVGAGPHFHAARDEIGDEFGGLGLPSPLPHPAAPVLKGLPGQNTTLAIVATDMALTRPQCRRLAIMASAGLARAIDPAFTPLDGDIVFAASTGRAPPPGSIRDLANVGAFAARCLARAVARAIYLADGPLPDGSPCWRDAFAT